MPPAYQTAIEAAENNIFLSAASVWEAVIKHQLGRLPFPTSPGLFLPEQRVLHGIASLPVDESAMIALCALPTPHRDPFDRIIIAQAIQHSLVVASMDSQFSAYPVTILPSK